MTTVMNKFEFITPNLNWILWQFHKFNSSRPRTGQLEQRTVKANWRIVLRWGTLLQVAQLWQRDRVCLIPGLFSYKGQCGQSQDFGKSKKFILLYWKAKSRAHESTKANNLLKFAIILRNVYGAAKACVCVYLQHYNRTMPFGICRST